MKICDSILDAIGSTPLVRLNRVSSDNGAEVLVKCEYLNPSGSTKDRIALKMIEEAEKADKLRPGGTITDETVMYRAQDGTLHPRLALQLEWDDDGGEYGPPNSIDIEIRVHQWGDEDIPWEPRPSWHGDLFFVLIDSVIVAETYDVRIRARTHDHVVSPWVVEEEIYIDGWQNPPPAPTGLVLEIPAGHEGQVRPRSGLAIKAGLTVVNAPGTIDSDYRGELKVLMVNLGSEPVTISRGDRIAQLLIAPVTRASFTESECLSLSDRGDGGFGSTGV